MVMQVCVFVLRIPWLGSLLFAAGTFHIIHVLSNLQVCSRLAGSPLSSERGLRCAGLLFALCIFCPVLGTHTAYLSMQG